MPIFSSDFAKLSGEERIQRLDEHNAELFFRVNLIFEPVFGKLIRVSQREDFNGIDATFVDRLGAFRRVQIKERLPNEKGEDYGKDLLIEIVAVWTSKFAEKYKDDFEKGIIGGLVTGRDTKLTTDYIVLVDKDENVFMLRTIPTIKLALDMFKDFMKMHYFSNGQRNKMSMVKGEVRIFVDPSDSGDYKGKNYRKCGAFIRPIESGLEILFQSKLLP